MASIRFLFLLGVLALALSYSAFAGALPVGPQPAVAADETGEETTTEEPPVVETPTEPETTPEPETPVTTPPVTTPPVGVPSGGESGGGVVETPKSTPSTGSEAFGGGGGGGSGGGGSSSGSSGASSGGGAATTSPASAPNRHTARTPTRAPSGGGSAGGGGSATGGSDGGSKVASGGGGSRNTGGSRDTSGGGGGHRAPSHSGGGPAPQPAVSTQGIDEGASAVSNAASHVGEAFAEALPTAPLKKIGDRLAAHLAGVGEAQGGKGEKASAEGIGKALGAALIGSAVAVDKKPVANTSPIPFFTPPGGKSSTVYLILIAALLLAVGALVFREVRKSLGLDAPRTGIRVADEKPRIALSERLGVALAGVQEVTHHWFSRFRRLRSSAVAGLRSLF